MRCSLLIVIPWLFFHSCGISGFLDDRCKTDRGCVQENLRVCLDGVGYNAGSTIKAKKEIGSHETNMFEFVGADPGGHVSFR
jgi:hypothetical protein